MTNDLLHSIGEKHPDLMAYLQGLKYSSPNDYRAYETAKGYLSSFPLSTTEYEGCIRFISERLKL
jgi:hypothetical protein